ncbi:MAG: ankryin [Luteitalea sp.]|nr:ankryin [Luteitalea sp.]
MAARDLPARPNLEQYKKQAKELINAYKSDDPEAVRRVREHRRGRGRTIGSAAGRKITLADAQFVIAREHGFDSWPKFTRHVETLRLTRSVASIADPVAAFIEAACVPRSASHRSGTLEHAEMILARYPHVAGSSIHTAAILADEASVRAFLARDRGSATAIGGPYGWDALTHLCFSRYLRLDAARSEAFVRTARAVLDAGASAKTGWYETIDHPNPRPLFESAIYGAAGIAQHPELTRLLLERGADPNDEETPYHVPETTDNTVLKILLESGTLNAVSLTWMLLRKTDWHDLDGLGLLLEHNADPNQVTHFGDNALHHAIRRDNSLKMIELLFERGADPALRNGRDARSATVMAARRGRGDVLALLERRGTPFDVAGVDRLIAACATDDRETIRALTAEEPHLKSELIDHGGTLLAEFAGVGNVAGVRNLLDCAVSSTSLHKEGDPYVDIAKDSTALHVAAWRGWPEVVKELIARGAPVHATDGKGRTALALAVKACVDSHWTMRRSPDSVRALLDAGASVSGVEVPSGYDEVDTLLRQHLG